MTRCISVTIVQFQNLRRPVHHFAAGRDARVLERLSGAYTLTCTTAQARRCFCHTLDGSNPSPRNGTFYTAPFTPGTELTLNVRAFLPGYLISAPLSLNT